MLVLLPLLTPLITVNNKAAAVIVITAQTISPPRRIISVWSSLNNKSEKTVNREGGEEEEFMRSHTLGAAPVPVASASQISSFLRLFWFPRRSGVCASSHNNRRYFRSDSQTLNGWRLIFLVFVSESIRLFIFSFFIFFFLKPEGGR